MSRQVAANAAWNVIGALATSLAGVVALALLLGQLGTPRMGVFTLALGLIGYSGLLDLGLGRALTQKVASDLGSGRSKVELAALVWRTLAFLACVGAAAGAVLWVFIPWVVHRTFKLEAGLATESIVGLRAVALSIPLALMTNAAAGALEGLQRFRVVSTQRTVSGLLQFCLPTAVSFWRQDVGWVIGALAVSRACAAALWLRALNALLPVHRARVGTKADYHQLIRFGGWLSVSNVVGPLMVYADRFYLASIFPAAFVAYYAIPLDSLMRITTLPVTAMGAVFPAIAASRTDIDKSGTLIQASLLGMVALLLPAMFMASVLSMQLLTLWLGAGFASHANIIFKWIVLGVFVNSVAHVPYVLLHGHDRADITAKLHVLELPLFIAMLVFAVSQWGLVGAAIAWTARAAVDTGLLYLAAMREYPAHRQRLLRGAALLLIACLALVMPLVGADWRWLLIAAAVGAAAATTAGRRLYAFWRTAKTAT